jgi:chitinase
MTSQTVIVTAQSVADPQKSAPAVVSLQSTPALSQWSMGYYQPWGYGGAPALPVSAIQWNGVTHVIHLAALVNPNGTLDLADGGLSTSAAALVTAAHANQVKVLMCLEAEVATNFNSAVENDLSTLVSNIMTVVNTYGYDGVDIDWEPSVGFDKDATNAADMTTLARALRSALGNKLLTVFAGASEESYFSAVYSLFDRLNLATYDLSCSWEGFGWHNSALYTPSSVSCAPSSLDQATTAYLSAGVPAAKFNLGLAFFGLKYSGGVLASDPTRGVSGPTQIASTTPTQTSLAYSAIAPLIMDLNYTWDPSAMVPYINYLGNTPSAYWYVTYDNPQSIQAKVQYIVAQHLGGWFIWLLGADYLTGNPHPQPLLDAVQAGSAPSVLSASTLGSGVVGTVYSASLSAAGAAPVQWSPSNGSLPGGLSLNSAGLISGIPTTAGTFTFVVTMENFAGRATQSFTITIAASTN